MEYGTLDKQIYIDATPDLVYEVISSPEHIEQWWADDADLVSEPGSAGTLGFHDKRVQLTIVEAVPGDRFAFRWNYPADELPTLSNSMLVTFHLIPEGTGTRLTVIEEGMREQGWEAAVLEEYYHGHSNGWNTCLSDLATYMSALPETA